MKTFIASLLLIFLIAGCHSTKKAAESKTPDASKTQPSTTDEIAAMKNLVVSFYSRGSGADHKAAKQLENFLYEYGDRRKMTIPYSKIPWGKEGEVDYCISLTGWADDLRSKFIGGVKDLLRGAQVHIKENIPCREIK